MLEIKINHLILAFEKDKWKMKKISSLLLTGYILSKAVGNSAIKTINATVKREEK